MRFIDGDELRRLVPMRKAIDVLEAAFRAMDTNTPPRQHVPFGDGELLFMPSVGRRGAGVKLVTVNPANAVRGLPLINGSYLFFDRETLRPLASIDAAALTALRTAAVSAVATRALSPPESERLVIFGAGTQAHSHLEAMAAVRPIRDVRVVSRSEDRARALVALAREIGWPAGVEAPEAVSSADIVCTCTTSASPVLDGRLLKEDAHVNAVGAYKRDAREIDSETVRRAGVVVVETLEVMAESGDLAVPLGEEVLEPARVVALRDVLDRNRPGTPEITLFKSVGQAFEDLAVAQAAVDALD